MTPFKLIVFRIYTITLGRFYFFSKLLRKIMEKFLITGKSKKKYVASSDFFDTDELKNI